MAHITKEYFNVLKECDLIQPGDWTNLSNLSKRAGIRHGRGYTRQTIAKIVTDGINTSDEMVALIRTYYEPKVDAYRAQIEMAKTIKMRMAFA